MAENLHLPVHSIDEILRLILLNREALTGNFAKSGKCQGYIIEIYKLIAANYRASYMTVYKECREKASGI